MNGSATSSRVERGWRLFAILVMGFAAIGGAAGAVVTAAQYHALTTRGVRTTAVVSNAWQVKGGRDCSVGFTDSGGVQRVETVSDCGGVQRGQTISVIYDRSDPSTIDPASAVTAWHRLGTVVFLALISALLSFCTWVLWRKPTWDARRDIAARIRPPLTGSFSGRPGKRVRYRPRS